MPHDVILSGCAPAPLAAYLKALGVLRLVAEQKDSDARGWWRDERFVLRSSLDERGLKKFFLEEYKPTPIIAPWNGGSGFYYREEKLKETDPNTGKRKKTGRRSEPTAATRVVDAVLSSKGERFKPYRESIACTKKILGKLNLGEAPKEGFKKNLVEALRSDLPDCALDCLDAILVLTTQKPSYPRLWGRGGTDGNLDFTSNMMQRLMELFDSETGDPKAGTESWLSDALFARGVPGLRKAAIGQFSPAQAGKANATTGFEADSLTNPWEFVLMLEGALFFAAAATRRLESKDEAAPSYPFTVRPAGGSGATALDDDRAVEEMWLPLWGRPARYQEVRALFVEGRATLGRRQARDGLDFARGVAALGVDRGIEAFQRYSFLKRFGDNHIATPLNRVAVRPNPRANRIDDLDRGNWLANFRRLARGKEAPARLSIIGRRLEDALFAMIREGSPHNIQAVLSVFGEAQAYLAANPKSRDPKAREFHHPLQPLRPNWMRDADDGSHEFRIAAALAGLGMAEGEAAAEEPPEEPGEQEETQAEGHEPGNRSVLPGLPMRFHLAPLESDKYGRDAWSESSRLVVWGGGELVSNLIRVLERRLIEAERRGGDEKPLSGHPGADAAAVAAFLRGETDDARIARLLRGLAWVRPPRSLRLRKIDEEVLPAAYAALKPIFSPEIELRRLRMIAPDARLPVPPGLVRLLAGGRVQEALGAGLARARASGMVSPFRSLRAGGLHGPRLAAALLIPLDDRTLPSSLKRIYPEPVPTSGE